jgi:bifunctional non-homologous end joining protein LigD
MPATRSTARTKKEAGIPGARPGALPRFTRPELATLVKEPPAGDRWLHEAKFDGYRILCRIEDKEVTLLSRNGKDWTEHFPQIESAARSLPARSALIDGEVVALDERGRSSFQKLQQAMKSAGKTPIAYYAFDLLHLDGNDLTGVPCETRRRLLAGIITRGAAVLRLSDHVIGQGGEFYREACRMGLEGMVSKLRDSLYRPGRGKDWLKVKCSHRQEFVIGGYTDPGGSRTGFGAVLVGVYEQGRLVYCGKVGTGFNEQLLRDLLRRLQHIERPRSPFADPPRGYAARGVHWTEPRIVAEVSFTEWTDDGILRHPSFLGVREDKSPAEVRREEPRAVDKGGRADDEGGRAPTEAAGAGKGGSSAGAAPGVSLEVERDPQPRPERRPPSGRSHRRIPAAERRLQTAAEGEEARIAGVLLTHPDRVLYPEQGITKRTLAEYYEWIAPRMLPHVAGRPLTLVRCPQGHRRTCFFQKHVEESVAPR